MQQRRLNIQRPWGRAGAANAMGRVPVGVLGAGCAVFFAGLGAGTSALVRSCSVTSFECPGVHRAAVEPADRPGPNDMGRNHDQQFIMQMFRMGAGEEPF